MRGRDWLLFCSVAVTLYVGVVGAIQHPFADVGTVGVILTSLPIVPCLLPLTLVGIAGAIRRKVRVVGWSALGILCTLWFGDFQLRAPSREPSDLRVMTYNIEHCLRGYRGVAEQINALDPDVCMLQEATTSWDVEKPEVQEFLRLFPSYNVHRYRDRIILSKHPVRSTEVHWLGDYSRNKIAQVVQIDFNGSPLAFVNVHMLPIGTRPHVPMLRANRAREYQDLMQVVESLRVPTVIGGDFNGIARGPNYALLTNQLTDAFPAAGTGFGLTLSAETPSRRIDMLFSTPEFRPLRCWSPWTRASDHLPVLAEYKLVSRTSK